MSWEPDFGWQRGHDVHAALYALAARVGAAEASRVVEACRDLRLGGAAVRHDGEDLVLLSGGEDAVDALAEASRDVETTAGTGRLPWQVRPPVLDDGTELVAVDGYWVRPEEAATLPARRREVAALVTRTLGARLAGPLQEECVDGAVVLAGQVVSGCRLTILTAPADLDDLERAARDGSLPEHLGLQA